MVYDTQWKCDINKNVLKLIMLMRISASCYGSPSPRDVCVGQGLQACKETARKL